jgi:hypothetical protein
MPRSTIAAVLCLGLLGIPCGPAHAQAVSTDDDRTVRPGDRIDWSGPAPHRVRFGGTVGTPAVTLTPMADVDKVLQFSPNTPLTDVEGMASSKVGGSPMLSATVKDDAATSGVSSFVFTCGRHPADMKSLQFKIAPKDGREGRILKIKAVGLDWILEKAGGDVQVDEP